MLGMGCACVKKKKKVTCALEKSAPGGFKFLTDLTFQVDRTDCCRAVAVFMIVWLSFFISFSFFFTLQRHQVASHSTLFLLTTD